MYSLFYFVQVFYFKLPFLISSSSSERLKCFDHQIRKNAPSLSGRDRKLELQYSPVYNAWDGSPAKSGRGPHFGMPTPVKTDGIHDPKPEDKAVVSVDGAKVPEVCVRQETPGTRD